MFVYQKVGENQTKRNIGKLQDIIKKIESAKDSQNKINTLNSLGVLVKYFYIPHLLATRITVKEDLGILKSIEKKFSKNLKKGAPKKAQLLLKLNRKIKKKKLKKNKKKELEVLKIKHGNELNEYKIKLEILRLKIVEKDA